MLPIGTPGAELAPRGDAAFNTTHWSVILSAAREDSPQAAAALEQLCRTYWYPLYAYVRREGHSPADAQDLTQEYFARLLERRSLCQVAPEKGKFRSFLLASMRHFLADAWDHAHAAKRGGRAETISLDAQEAERRYALEPADRLDAEKLYERRWAITLLQHAVDRLREESVAAGKAKWFEVLAGFIAGERDISCSQAAAALGMSNSAVKSAIYRLRQRYRELIVEEIERTVIDTADVQEEVRYLIQVAAAAGL